MNYVIHPFRGVGSIEFGMTPKDVRDRMRADFKSFKRTPQVVFPSDYFPSEGAFFYYNPSGLLEAIELAAIARPTVSGIDLLNIPFGQLVTKLSAFDNSVEEEIDGVIAHNLGVSVYAPFAKEDRSAPAESVLAFQRGYYS